MQTLVRTGLKCLAICYAGISAHLPCVQRLVKFLNAFCAHVQQQSKVCIQTCALLYIAAFCSTPNCHGIVSQLITGNYVIKFERNSFRVQLSARGIATCFASAQPKSKSNSNHSGKISGTCK